MTIYVWANTWDKAIIEAHRGNYHFTLEKAKAEFKHSDVQRLFQIRLEEVVWK